MKKTNILKTLLLGFTLAAFTGCGEDLDKADYDRQETAGAMPTVVTGSVESYGIAAKASLTVNIPEGAEVKEAGFVVSTSAEMSLTDAGTQLVKADAVNSGEETPVALLDLVPGTTYYVKAYAYAKGGIVYGDTKTITASDNYERGYDFMVDFADPDFADGQYFTGSKLDGSVVGFSLISLQNLFGVPQYAYVSSPFHPGKLQNGSASLVSAEENNLLSMKADLTGKPFPAVTIDAFNLAALFGDSFADCPGDIDVYISEQPVTNAEELAAATLLGTCAFSDDTTSPDFEEKVVTYNLPLTYDGECYITIHSHCGHPNYYDGNNLGVLIIGMGLSSLHQIAQ